MRLVVASLTASLLPTFLVGALSPTIAADLEVGPAVIGAAVSAFFLAAALTSLPAGRLVDRRGATFGYRSGLVGVALAAAAIGLLVSAGWQLAVGLAATGASLACIDPSIARTITRSVGWRRQGIAFGIKEISAPSASMLAGITLPLLGTTIGWRVPFLVVAGFAIVVALLVPSDIEVARARRGGARTARSDIGGGAPVVAEAATIETARSISAGTSTRAPTGLLLVAVTGAVVNGVSAAVATFLVPTSIVIGVTATAAGLLLSAASLLSIGVRLGAGWMADRRPTAVFDLLLALVVAGLAGTIALAAGSHLGAEAVEVDPLAGEVVAVAEVVAPTTGAVLLVVVGAGLLLGPGWGWTAVAFLTATRLAPDRPAQASGALLAGLGGGGALVPIAAGWLAERSGFGWTWTVGAVAMTLAAALMVVLRTRGRAA